MVELCSATQGMVELCSAKQGMVELCSAKQGMVELCSAKQGMVSRLVTLLGLPLVSSPSHLSRPLSSASAAAMKEGEESGKAMDECP
jgi:hypothetical protein